MSLRERLFRLFFGRKMAKYSEIPGPTPKLLGNAADFMGDKSPWDVCEEYGEEYGGSPIIWLFNKPVLVLLDPGVVEDVLGGERPEFLKKDPVKALLPVTTKWSLFTATQKTGWKEKRTGHPFSHDWAKSWHQAQIEPMRKLLEERVQAQVAADAARPGQWHDAVSLLRRWAFDAFAVAAVGHPLSDSSWKHFMQLARTGNRRINLPVVPTPPLWPMFYWHRRQWYHGFLADIEETRTKDPGERPDLLALMMRHGLEADDPTMEHIIGLFFFGGVFSVSASLIAAFFNLAHHEAEHDRLSQAVVGLTRDGSYDAEALASAPYVEAVVREAMRLLPPVPLFMRQVYKGGPVKIGDYEIPADTTLWISNILVHHDEDKWSDPREFRPERWLDGGFAKNPIGGPSFFPFGRGPRSCIGADFAMVYMQVALAAIVKHAKVEFLNVEPYEEKLFFGVVEPKNVRIRFAARSPGSDGAQK